MNTKPRVVITDELRKAVIKAVGENTREQVAEMLGCSRKTVDRIVMEAGLGSKRAAIVAAHAEMRGKVLAALADGRTMTTSELRKELGLTQDAASNLLQYLQEKCHVEMCGAVMENGFRRGLWRTVLKPGESVNIKFRRSHAEVQQQLNPIIPPTPRYASPFGHLLGEPPIGRSALDQKAVPR